MLITIDSLRADHLSCYGYYKKTSPNIDELAKKGVIFKQAISNAPITSASFQSILTSTYPLMYEGYGHLSKHRIPIQEVLKENGYCTIGVHFNGFLSHLYGWDRSFDEFEDFLSGHERKQNIKKLLSRSEKLYKLAKWGYNVIFKKDIPYRRGEIINKEVVRRFKKQQSKNLFCFIHYMDCHYPLYPPREYLPKEKKTRKRGLNKRVKSLNASKNDLKSLMDLYDAEITHVDHCIRDLMEFFNDIGILDNSLLIITADHGDEFFEHGNFFHNPKLYDELLHVPLIIYTRSEDLRAFINDQVSLIDLSPTILDFLAIEKPDKFLGRSLLPLIRGKEKGSKRVISEASLVNEVKDGKPKIDLSKKIISCRTPEWKFIWKDHGSPELYNFKNDSKEKENLHNSETYVAKDFKEEIKRHLSALIDSWSIAEVEKVKKRIRKLKRKNKLGKR